MITKVFKYFVVPLAAIYFVGGAALAYSAAGTGGHSIGGGIGATMHGFKEVAAGLRESQAYEADTAAPKADPKAKGN